jgi:very-short-patch-repair endonuclease
MVKADIRRDRFLRDCGLKVLRFNDTEVSKNIEGVFEVILENVTSRK